MGHRDAEFAGLRFFAQDVEAMELLLDVEEGGRFVQQQDRSVLGEARREQNALALPAAQSAEVAMTMLPAVGSFHGLANKAVILVRLKPSVRVRVPSHRHQLLCRVREVRVDSLREMTHPLRELAQIPISLIASRDGD